MFINVQMDMLDKPMNLETSPRKSSIMMEQPATKGKIVERDFQ